MGMFKRKKRDGTGPFIGSWMWRMGFRGPMAGRRRGKCWKRNK